MTQGTCSRVIEFEVEEGKVKDVVNSAEEIRKLSRKQGLLCLRI